MITVQSIFLFSYPHQATAYLTRNQGFMAHLIYLSALLKLESAPASALWGADVGADSL